MSDYAPLSAAILVGGLSRRMGTDKALLTLGGSGGAGPLTSVAHLIGVVATCCDDVMLVGGEPERFASLDLAVRRVPDAVADSGPLGGILGALEASRHNACLVVACDMPFVTPEVVHAMAGAPRDYSVLAFPGEDDPEPLLAIYAVGCIGPLRASLAAGELQARRFLARVGAQPLAAEIVARVDPDHRAVTNVNTPEDLAAFRLSWVQAPKPPGGSTRNPTSRLDQTLV